MAPRPLILFACVAALAASASAQFSAFDWSFRGTGTTAASVGAVSGPDELTLEVLNCIGYAGSVTAEAVAHDTGRFTFDLTGEEWISSCSSCGFGYCGGTTTAVGNTCVPCSPFAWCVEPVQAELWGGACNDVATWRATWSLDVIEGRCWQIAIAQDGWSLDCNSRLVASGLVFEAAPDVTLLSASPTPAYKATTVTLTGVGFDAVEQVFVDGAETAILARTPNELVIRPPIAPAGDVAIALRDDTFLLADEPGALTRWPAATAALAPGALAVDVEAGLPGAWQLVVSLDDGPPLTLGGTFGALVLDVVSAPWFWTPGVLDGNGHGQLVLPIPPDPGLSGLDVHLQARTPAGFGSPFAWALSNAVEVELP